MSPISWKPTQRQVLILSILILLLCTAGIEFEVLSYTKGVWVYPQDEAYTRMTIAKNFAFNHMWGIARHDFSPASSSILYPIILAVIYFIFGNHLIISFIVNLAAGIALLFFVQKWLVKETVSAWNQLWILLTIILLVPLPVLVVIGMEHVVQMLLAFLFIYQYCDWVSDDQPKKMPISILLYGILSTAIRYEGLFIVLIACIWLLIRKRSIDAIKLGVISILPIILFGLYSLSKGGYFLPNSILIKSVPIPLNWDSIRKFISEDMFDKLMAPFPSRGGVAAERILLIIPLLFGIFWGALTENRKYRFILLFTLGVTILHMMFANTIFYYRYEAYLISLLIPICGVVIGKGKKMAFRKITMGGFAIVFWTAIVLFYPFVIRGWDSYRDTAMGCTNMFEQDYLVAQFLHRYYDKTPIVADDLGAISYMTVGNKLDLNAGIGNMEITKSKVEQYYRPDYLEFLIRKERPRIAVVSERKCNPWLLSKWKKIGTWHTYNVLQPYGDKFLSFYAIDSNAAPDLKRKLEQYEPFLPPGVKAGYFYDPVAMK